MLDLQQGLAGNHGNSSDPVVGLQMNGSRENSGAINLESDVRRKNFGDAVGGGMPQFRLQTQGEGGDESGVSSPPLWKASPPGTPTEASPLNPHHHHQHQNRQHQHHHHHHQRLPPTSRLQAIARGRQEMMEMVRSMPESSYELSLKDLVEQPKMKAIQQEPAVVDRNPSNNSTDGSEKGKKRNKKMNEKPKMRSGSMDNEGFLLKMFFPTLGQKKKKNSTTGPCAKVSPRPSLEGSEKSVDKEWWKKRFSSAGEAEKGRTDSINGSVASSSSSSSTRSRHMSGCLPGCWSFLFSKKRKAT